MTHLKLPLLFCLILASSINQAQTTPNQVGFWWKPSNPTWGISLQQQGTHTFALWFTYNVQGKPVWYALNCDFIKNANDSRCAGDLFTGTGTSVTKITASANAQFMKVGEGSLTLSASDKLALSYAAVGGVAQQIIDLERLNIATTGIPTCTLQAGTRANVSNYTDFWWGGVVANGWGIHITHQAKQLFLSWGSYDDQGNASWIFGLGTQAGDSPQFSGDLYQFPSGTPFSQSSANNATALPLGSFSLQFANGEQGSFTYSLPIAAVSNRSLPLERFALAGNGDVNVCAVTTTLSNAQQASRFLAQATFGAKMADIDALVVNQLDYAAWINTQVAKPQGLHLPNAKAYFATLSATQQKLFNPALSWSLWKNFATSDDQLRQRIAFALSEILVISLDSTVKNYPLGPAQYLDTLGSLAFGNYRDILNAVSYSPMMGVYLSALHNQKEDAKSGRVPDENYAREIMQLFSIGLYQLNVDGTTVLNVQGQPIETYTNADITGLAKVFTGLSWAGPDTSAKRFFSNATQDLENQVKPMQAYDAYHSISEKKFLNVTIPAQKTADTRGDIKIALDTLFNHPNVGPFIGKQLIQRLITSNPTPAYVAWVATAFNNNGQGVRGDMQAVVKAILLDPEAREPSARTTQSGKLREPIVRLVQWLRSFNATSSSGLFMLGSTAKPDTQLAQSPLLSPSVFNFFRPGYVPPNSKVGDADLVAPEMQISTETSIAGYLNFMRQAITNGVGTSNDLKADYSVELALANDPEQLLDRVSLLLAANLSPETRRLIRDAIASVSLATNSEANKLNRVKLAIYLVMATPDYILQN